MTSFNRCHFRDTSVHCLYRNPKMEARSRHNNDREHISRWSMYVFSMQVKRNILFIFFVHENVLFCFLLLAVQSVPLFIISLPDENMNTGDSRRTYATMCGPKYVAMSPEACLMPVDCDEHDTQLHMRVLATLLNATETSEASITLPSNFLYSSSRNLPGRYTENKTTVNISTPRNVCSKLIRGICHLKFVCLPKLHAGT